MKKNIYLKGRNFALMDISGVTFTAMFCCMHMCIMGVVYKRVSPYLAYFPTLISHTQHRQQRQPK